MVGYKEYDEKTLKKLHNVELEMLKDFIYICEKHNIKYFAIDGTALGAVRHNGIIPWDDDIDLGLLREDYNKFVKIADVEFADKYYFVNYKKNKEYFFGSGRWCKKGTIFIDEPIKDIKIDLGIFIDIYPFDYVNDDEKISSKQIKKAWLLGKLSTLRNVPQPVIYYSGFSAKIILFLCRIGNFVLKVLRINHTKLLDKAFSYINKSTKKTNTICFPFGEKPTSSLYKVDDVFPTKKIEFDGLKINIPNNANRILTHIYGDYMKFPPVSERHNHYPYKLEFEVKNKSEK